jgi:heptosyltransferase-1
MTDPENEPSADPPERILLVRLSHLGDVVHALPVWHAVARAFPTARLAFATQPAYAPLLEGLERLEAIVPFDRGGGLGAWWRFRRSVRRFRPTWTIDCQGNWKGAMATRLSGAPRRSGLAPSLWREPSARRLLNDLAPEAAAPPMTSHAGERQLSLARHVVGHEGEPNFGLDLTAEELDVGHRTLAHCLAATGRVGSSPPPLLLHLARPGDPRSWPAAEFFELARLAADAGWPVLILGGPDERDLVPEAMRMAELPGIHAELGTLALRPLAALFAAASARGGRLVACDSGPAHLAAATALCVHLLFGPQSPARTGPWPPAEPDGLHSAQTSALDLDCRPCLLRACPKTRGAECLFALDAAEVFRALCERP